MELNLGDLQIESGDITPLGPIPERFTSDGSNVSPALSWSGIPDGAVELVLVVHDPDAPLADGFTHWAVHGIDPSATGVEEGGVPRGTHGTAIVDRNEMGDAEYTGPAPPPGHGPHHYFFHLYALDAPIAADDPIDRAELIDRMEGHIIEQARLVATYEK